MPKEVEQVFSKIRDKLESIIFGQQMAVDLMLIGLLAEGHVLLEGVPGTAKTLLVKTFAQLINVDFNRVQLTPDMMPSDIIGNSVYDLNSKKFYIKKGPIFTDFLLADEINRTPPKTQSALLEAMEERQVTIDGNINSMGDLFMIFATQNPVEFEGTYPLPEAQLDRFMFKIVIEYPGKEAEKSMLISYQNGFDPRKWKEHPLDSICSVDEIKMCRAKTANITVEDSILNYIIELISRTRNLSDVMIGASPRAAVIWLNASKACAAINGQQFVTPDHIKYVAKPLLRHRIILTPEAELEGVTNDQIINNILNQVPVPR
ncbi:MAG: MoxR family ATPase [Cyanobacteriota bacterium]